MKPWYAINARRLLEDRQRASCPSIPCPWSLATRRNPGCLYVKPDMPVERLDWRMLVNLPVWIWAAPGR
jgi:hypothetical protein